MEIKTLPDVTIRYALSKTLINIYLEFTYITLRPGQTMNYNIGNPKLNAFPQDIPITASDYSGTGNYGKLYINVGISNGVLNCIVPGRFEETSATFRLSTTLMLI